MKRASSTSVLVALSVAAWTPVLAADSVGDASSSKRWPRGSVFVPDKLFASGTHEEIILESNPRVFLYPDFDPDSDKILVVGMDGWGGRSENFIDTMRLGLKAPGLTNRLVLAAIQDPDTRGPRFQGQGDREHANVWSLDPPSIPVLRTFVEKIADKLQGHLRVYFMGYSTGSAAAPRVAVMLGKRAPAKKYTVEGSICLGTGSGVSAASLKAQDQRVLFLVVPKQRNQEHPARRYDQGNRSNAEASHIRLSEGGAKSYLRHIESARRHIDWHWGLMSQCRYFRPKRYDDGRGYWPNYWQPNPDSWGLMAIFIQGKEPPQSLPPTRTKCKYAPNPNNPDDPG